MVSLICLSFHILGFEWGSVSSLIYRLKSGSGLGIGGASSNIVINDPAERLRFQRVLVEGASELDDLVGVVAILGRPDNEVEADFANCKRLLSCEHDKELDLTFCCSRGGYMAVYLSFMQCFGRAGNDGGLYISFISLDFDLPPNNRRIFGNIRRSLFSLSTPISLLLSLPLAISLGSSFPIFDGFSFI